MCGLVLDPEDRAATFAFVASHVAAVERRAVEMARPVFGEAGDGRGAILTLRLPAEGVENRLRSVRGKLENCSVVFRAAFRRRAVEIAGGIHHQAGFGVLAIPAAEDMERRRLALRRDLEHRAHAVPAAEEGRAVEIARPVRDEPAVGALKIEA